MAYTQMENLGGGAQDRQFSIFTTANIAGGFIGAGGMWLLGKTLLGSEPAPSPEWFLRVGLIVVGIVAGVVITMHVNGLTLHQRLMLVVQHQARRLTGRHIIQPDKGLSARTGPASGVVTIYRDGQPVIRPWVPEEGSEHA